VDLFNSTDDHNSQAMTQQCIIFSDLDDTLFQTKTKTERWPATTDRPLTAAAYDRDGQPLSYHAPAQQGLLTLLQDATWIPVTGRNHQALTRVVSPVFSDYWITSHGAMIYDAGGHWVTEWYDAYVAPVQQETTALLQQLLEQMQACYCPIYPQLRVKIIEDQSIPVYLSLKWPRDEQGPERVSLQQWLPKASPGWRLHYNGHNAAMLPPYACKKTAVAWLMRQWRAVSEDVFFLGLGDSESDYGFLSLCDFVVIPRYSQLQAILNSMFKLETDVTQRQGAMA
jgi:hydroxymethylpyrimidine pyrophosphatase-like HAD family hydrolase